MFCQEANVRVVQFSRAWCDNKRSYPMGWPSGAGTESGLHTFYKVVVPCTAQPRVCFVLFCLFIFYFWGEGV